MRTVTGVPVLAFLVISACAGQLGVGGLEVGFTDVIEVLRLGRESVIDVLESWKLISERVPGNENLDFPFVRRMERELRNEIMNVSLKISALEYRMQEAIESAVTRLLIEIPMQRQLELNFREFSRYMGQIDDLYEVFVMYAKSPDSYERYTLEDFARTCVSSNPGALPDILKSMHRLMIPSQDSFYNNNSILMVLVNQMQVGIVKGVINKPRRSNAGDWSGEHGHGSNRDRRYALH